MQLTVQLAATLDISGFLERQVPLRGGQYLLTLTAKQIEAGMTSHDPMLAHLHQATREMLSLEQDLLRASELNRQAYADQLKRGLHTGDDDRTAVESFLAMAEEAAELRSRLCTLVRDYAAQATLPASRG